VNLKIHHRPQVSDSAATRGSNQRIAKMSALASFAVRRPPNVEKISSIQDAGNAVRANLHKLKMMQTFTAGSSLRSKASMLVSALEAPGKGVSARFEAKSEATSSEQPAALRFERASSAPAHVSSVAAAPLRSGDGKQTIMDDRRDQAATSLSAPAVKI